MAIEIAKDSECKFSLGQVVWTVDHNRDRAESGVVSKVNREETLCKNQDGQISSAISYNIIVSFDGNGYARKQERYNEEVFNCLFLSQTKALIYMSEARIHMLEGEIKEIANKLNSEKSNLKSLQRIDKKEDPKVEIETNRNYSFLDIPNLSRDGSLEKPPTEPEIPF